MSNDRQKNMGDLRSLRAGEIVDYFRQRHNAARAGKHQDIRVGSAETGLYSWATRKEMPLPGGRPIMAPQQPIHLHSYGSYSGKINTRHGMGDVEVAEKGKVKILEVSPRKLKFVTTHLDKPQTFTMVHKGKTAGNQPAWLIFNSTPKEEMPILKAALAMKRARMEKEAGPLRTTALAGLAALLGGVNIKMPIARQAERVVANANHAFKAAPEFRVGREFNGFKVIRTPAMLEEEAKALSWLDRQAAKSLAAASPEDMPAAMVPIGTNAVIYAPGRITRRILEHESGHGLAARAHKGGVQGYNSQYGGANFRGNNVPLEEEAWNLAGVPKNDPERIGALGTYQFQSDNYPKMVAGDILSGLGLAGMAGAGALPLLRGAANKLQNALIRRRMRKFQVR